MKWIADYSTGIQRIDEQHAALFQMSEDFRAALDEGEGRRTYGLLLENLGAYCRGHFGFEERCMEEHHCPVALRNKQAHTGFMMVLADFQQRYTARGFQSADAGELLDALDQWLSSHIVGIDVALHNCV